MDKEKFSRLRIDKGKNNSTIKNEQYLYYEQFDNSNFININLNEKQFNTFKDISNYFKFMTLNDNQKEKFLKENEIEDKVYLSFFLLCKKYQNSNFSNVRYIYPMIAVPINSLKLRENSLYVDNIDSLMNYTVLKNVLINILMIDENNIYDGENIIEFFSKLINENLRNKSFLEILDIVSSWVENRLLEIDSPYELHKTANKVDSILSQIEVEDFTKFIYNDIKYKKDNCLKQLEKDELVKSYLFEEFEENNNVQKEEIYKGAFGKYPLSLGQAIVMQQIENEEIMTAVQGAPGTGKTTLLLSIIANRITKRALSLISNNDFDNLMLITSTSNKAVDNVSEAFSKDFDNYSWLYFIWGSTKKKNISFQRLEDTISLLKEEKEVYNDNRAKNLENEILFFNNKIDNLLKDYKVLKEQINSIKNELIELENDIYNLNKRIQEEYFEEYNLKEIEDNKDLFDKLYIDIHDIQKELDKNSIVIFIQNLFGRKRTLIKNFIALKENIVKRTFNKVDFNNYQDILRVYSKIEYFYSSQKKVQDTEYEIHQIEEKIIIKKQQLEILENKYKEKYNDSFLSYFKNESHNDNFTLFNLSLEYIWEIILKNKTKIVQSLEEWYYAISFYGRDDRKSEFYKNLKYHKKNISLVYPVMTSTLASSMSLFYSQNSDIYDYLIVDEAGMITLNLLFPLLCRSKKTIVVGDPKQLEPIITLSDDEKNALKDEWHFITNDDNKKIVEYERFSPTMSSSYHRVAKCNTSKYDDIGNGIELDEHRRCLEDIAQIFIKIAKYDRLKIKTSSLETNNRLYKPYINFGNKSIYHFNVQINQMKNNINEKEIKEIDKILEQLNLAGFDLYNDIGIITPYRNQASKLISKFKRRINHTRKLEKIGTVHKFQGAEFPVVIFSSVVGKNDSIGFINSKPNMLNVAVSRAKYVFITVGNIDVLSKGKYTKKLIN
ncbi:hypothetical protein CRU98_04680 [Arcobacter sp. CECT 8986]|uniref:AAA domain-containing protein n=1 Tax=Arcobacter sp. CECT 8986 TaxID=2044507 RepID=UPI001009CE3E|nr:AAA domain-containing protein [Arcobacter sp. CECT 8986]RXK00458.1 hypothetical protein CRU98_04680 [Arcobacter sp. CECT 8986]